MRGHNAQRCQLPLVSSSVYVLVSLAGGGASASLSKVPRECAIISLRQADTYTRSRPLRERRWRQGFLASRERYLVCLWSCILESCGRCEIARRVAPFQQN